MKSELFFLKQYGFTENVLEELLLYCINPLDLVFDRDFREYMGFRYKFTAKEQELSRDKYKYLEFRERFYKKNFIEDKKISKIFYKYDKNNINQLINDEDRPLFMYGSGDIELLNQEKKRIAIVGTRTPSREAVEATTKLVGNLVEKSYIIVSGLAEGIDTVAHKECINRYGKTIAVLPTNFNDIYPKKNELLAKEISNNGLLLTEIGPNENTFKSSFLERNKYVASISDLIIVVETNLKSGTMNTIRNAFELNKKIFYFNQNSIEVNNQIKNFGGELINESKLQECINYIKKNDI